MNKPRATTAQMVRSKLMNRKPVRCAVCNNYICPFTGLPVMLDNKSKIIEFAHPDCCMPPDLGGAVL